MSVALVRGLEHGVRLVVFLYRPILTALGVAYAIALRRSTANA